MVIENTEVASDSFQGAIFCVSSSMQLIVKLLRPGRIIQLFFFFFATESKVSYIFEGGSSVHLLARFVLRGLESEKGQCPSRLNRLLVCQSMARARVSPASFKTSPPMVHSWEGAVMTGSLLGHRYTTLGVQKGEV